MPPPKKEEYRHFFSFVNVNNRSICQVDDDTDPEGNRICGHSLQGSHHSNLKRHIQKQHPELYEEIEKKRARLESEKKVVPIQTKLFNYGAQFGKQSVNNVKLSFPKILLACLKLVTVDGRPFSAVEDEGIRMLYQPVLKAIGDCPPTITRHRIRELVITAAAQIRKLIKEQVKDRMVCVKVDCATRNERSFLGINIQFRNELGEFKRYTLGCTEVTVSHTGENLKKEILQVLAEYGLDSKKIYTITSDNGANMIRCITLFNEDESNAEGSEPLTPGAGPSVDEDFDIVEITEEVEDDSDIESDNTDSDHLATSVLEGLHSKQDSVFGIRCAAHTLQLGVHDWFKNIKNSEYNDVIAKARGLVKHCREPNMRNRLKKEGLKNKLILDCPTRWSSTYKMLECLAKGKSHIMKVDHLLPEKMSSKEWDDVDVILRILKPCAEATTKIQQEDILLPDIYKWWLQCILELENTGYEAAKTVIEHLKKREEKLFENECFLASLFLDPRFNVKITESKVNEIKAHLQMLYQKCFPSTVTVNEPKAESVPEPLDALDQFFRRTCNREDRNNKCAEQELNEEIELYRKTEKLMPMRTDLLHFWRLKKEMYPNLYKLACVILGIPGTQCSVERLFSNLKFIFGVLRESLESLIINDILLLRSNMEVLEKRIDLFLK